MSLLQQKVISGEQMAPPRVVIYGAPGIGKTTFAASASAPLFIDLEGSADYLPVDKIKPQSFKEFDVALDAVLNENHEYKTLVIDSLDWLEKLIHDDICEALKIKQLNDPKHSETSYNKGYVLAVNKFIGVRNKLDQIRIVKKMPIILTAHALQKTRDNPLDGQYDEIVLKTHDKLAAAAVEWADAVLLLKHRIAVSESAQNGKVQGGRVLITDGKLGTTTKNRLNLPAEIQPVTWSSFCAAINTNIYQPTV